MWCILRVQLAGADVQSFPGQRATNGRESSGRVLYHAGEGGQAPGGRVPVHCLQRRRRAGHRGHAAGRPL